MSQPWNNTKKWCVRHADDKEADLSMLKYYLLREENCDPNETSPLHFAASGSNMRIIDFLISNGVPVNGKDTTTCATPLHWACSAGNLSSVKLLLDSKADISVIDDEGNTPLHYAVEKGYIKIAKYLVQRGANIDVTNIRGLSPLGVACEEEEEKLIKYLLKKGASVEYLIPYYVKNNNPRIVRLLVKYGEISQENFNGKQNPLHYAILFERIRVTKVLLRYSSWLSDCTDTNGRKPVDLITKNSNPTLISLLSR